MSEFKTLHWRGPFGGDWVGGLARKYRNGEFNGLSISAPASTVISNLEFLDGIPGIRSLEVRSRVKDDTAAFMVPSIEELSLATRCRVSVPGESSQPALEKLIVMDRPGLSVARHWPNLRSIRVGEFKGENFDFLENAINIESVYIEGGRQEGALDGIGGCSALAELVCVNYSIRSSGPLRGLEALSEVKLMAAPPTSPHGRINLSDIAGMHLEKLWISNTSTLENIQILPELPMLREVRLIGCDLDAADRQILNSLSSRTSVTIRS